MKEGEPTKSSLGNKTDTVQDVRRNTIITIDNSPPVEKVHRNSGASSNSSRDSYTSAFRRSQASNKTSRRRSIISTNKSKVVREIRYPAELRGLYNVKISPNEDIFITSYGAGVIQLRHLNHHSKNVCVEIRSLPAHGFPIMNLKFVNNGSKFFATEACGSILLCGLREGQNSEFAKEEVNEINAMDINIREDTLVSGGKDATLRIYDINTGKIKYNFKSQEEADYHKMRIFAIRCHNEMNEVFLSGGWDDCVKIWDTREPYGLVRQIKGPHICGDAIDVRDKIILTGSWTVDKSLQTWDFTSSKLISTITPVNRPCTINGEFIYCAQFYKGDPTPVTTVISGGSGVGAVEVTDIEEKRVMSSYKVNKSVQAIDSNSNHIIFGGMESVIRIVKV